ncbi:histidine phosphatase family protein [Acinetobacter sp. S40]|uniref:phosphoglycerate mutase family protein n=1 Tax=unclassified Acinetobacter TaxID=196816 RepID=UPI00190D73B4|nr:MULTISPECIES: phosphoglycerate mutase family protein [unclassified Acinetobacter]MBJ9984537.1 histidine phosphatase family protein [Acinetobacter sp. S40]MBK0062254.1 histidine phosphatase family protein [Acinetobacter sp. S55]MBK0066058.1 histidine phosphatase family protein [Acinetobacter sp. S54]
MQLTLVRHGEAASPVDGNDTKRPLTALGHAQAEQTAQHLKDRVQPEVFVVSPLLRAQETLGHIQAYFPKVPVLLCDKIKPEDDAKDAIDWLSQLPFESVVVVCHMNVVGHIAEQLTHEHFNPFALAEARIYSQSVIANGLSTQEHSFIPTL